MTTAPTASLEARIAERITAEGSVVISPRMARWLEKQSGMTADRRIRLRDSDPEAYIALTALHLTALRSENGTNDAAAQPVNADLVMWISTPEAAKALNVTDRCVRKWCQNGKLRAVMAGSRWLIDPSTLALKGIV